MTKEPTSRILLVSNRLPVTVSVDGNRLQISPSPGGLATGLKGSHEQENSLWLGWPGETADLQPEQRTDLEQQLKEMRCVPIHLDAGQIEQFYQGFSNGVLWPLFHYLLDRVQLDAWKDWDAYLRVNEHFAAAVIAQYRPGDLIWIHDYHLTMLPQLLRKMLPQAKIGFFLHTPFPSSETFRILPWRQSLLEGLLGADLIGFHTYSYLRNLSTSLLRILGIETHVDRIRLHAREIRLGIFPIGIDVHYFEDLSTDLTVQQEVQTMVQRTEGCKILLGIDRLDYTKGLPRRLLGFEQLLAQHPSWREKVRLIQVVVPSRTDTDEYGQLRRTLEEHVGRINGRYGTVHWTPIQYLFRPVSQRVLVALYRLADVMLVTPLRDGMNLVAKEFVACRSDTDGVLILSEFAGAASEMMGALLVNPYDTNQMAAIIEQALSLPQKERQARMRGMRERVTTYNNTYWFQSFVEALQDATRGRSESAVETSSSRVAKLSEMVRQTKHVALFIDYEGTLAALDNPMERHGPDRELYEILKLLSQRPGMQIHLVSGADHASLETWFQGLSIGLHAEYGFWSRLSPTDPWQPRRQLSSDWKDKVRPILEDFTMRTPGSFIEEKSVSLVWHYRQAETQFGMAQARELRLHLSELLSNSPVSVLHLNKTVEILYQGIHKGLVVPLVSAQAQDHPLTVVMGNDAIEESLFEGLTPEGLAIRLGPGPSYLETRLAEPQQVRAFFSAIS